MSRLLAPPPTDRSMWRQLLKLTHPDGSGSHDLFIWCQALFEHVAGDAPEDPPHYGQSGYREPPPHHPKTTVGDRVDFVAAYTADFRGLVFRAVDMSYQVGEPYGTVLRLLEDCYPSVPTDHNLRRQETVGATYKQVAAIAYRVGFSKAERSRWYRICEEIPMAQRMAGHILSRL